MVILICPAILHEAQRKGKPMIRMASVEQALDLIASHGRGRAMGRETISLTAAEGRRLAEPVIAQVSQPPADVSSMDGYAVRFADMAMNAELRVIGESRAGAPWSGKVGAHQAVRIFTGAIMPQGADHVLIQEDCIRENDEIEVMHAQKHPENIRRTGLDFARGATLVPAGFVMNEGAISLAAAGNVAKVVVAKTPRVGVLACGDELVAPGGDLAVGQIVNSIQPALLALISRWGAIPVDLGLARDTEEDVRKRIASPCDLIVSIGGASVGDYDVVRTAFAAEGFAPVFEKIAIKPGKPTWFSATPSTLVLGLPGNPAAAMVTAQLFLRPLIDALTNAPPSPKWAQRAHTVSALPKAGNREEYLRAILTIDAEGRATVQAAENQDSSLLSPFLSANALIRRPPNTAAAAAGDLVDIVTLR
jgi:molybdopterin molybdotransferase